MSLSSPVALLGADDGVVSAPSNPDGPTRRRSFTPTQKLRYLTEYETAVETGQGGAFLRRQGLYSSLISEWRKQRDAGLLEGKSPGDAVGRPSAVQAENARLKAQLRKAEQKLATTEIALQIMGKAHALLESISESADTDPRPEKADGRLPGTDRRRGADPGSGVADRTAPSDHYPHSCPQAAPRSGAGPGPTGAGEQAHERGASGGVGDVEQ